MFKRVKVHEFEKGLLFRNGRYLRLLEPGIHWIRGEVTLVDMRRRDTMVDTGPVLTRDLVPVGVLSRVSYRVTDPEAALLKVHKYDAYLDYDAMAAIHRSVSTVAMADLAAEHLRLEHQVHDRLALEVASYGVRVEDVAILEIRFPRALRRKLKRMEVPGPS
jgi:regulator of protease activity HflC (stomatin/prohibitin superfamily)